MLRCDGGKNAFGSFGAWVFLLSLILMAPANSRAEERTPPSYPNGSPNTTSSEQKPFADLPGKDFSSLFSEPAPASGPEEPRGGGASSEKADPVGSNETLPDMSQEGMRTEEYTVKEGDYLIKILKERGLLKDQNLADLLSLLRQLNSSLKSLDMIRPGEKIVILVKVVPGVETEEKRTRKLKYERYRVKRGDILSRLAIRRYQLSARQFNRDYLKLFAQCNPTIEDPNRILVGQIIKLPHYPPAYRDDSEPETSPVLRDLEASPHRIALKEPMVLERSEKPLRFKPIPSPGTQPPKPVPQPAARDASPSRQPVKPKKSRTKRPSERSRGATIIITDGLGTVISDMGEEWIQSGEHFIPMKSGGHINLNAESYPIVRLKKGMTVIVDMHHALPRKIARFIESTWSSYRVVRLSQKDDLRSALDKILKAFGYPKILKNGEPLVLEGNIPLRITGDWIITPHAADSEEAPEYVVINLMDIQSEGLPSTIKEYLKLVGVEVIEYPRGQETPKDAGVPSRPKVASEPVELIEAVLNYRGQPFKTRVNIPAYTSRNEDFTFTVEADFYLEIKGHRYVIDTGGMGPDVISLLKDNGISVLSLAQEKAPADMVSTILKFLDVHYKTGPHFFMAKRGDELRNVRLTLDGITFHDKAGNSVLVTSVNLPSELVEFLYQKGYRVLFLEPFLHSDSGHA